MLRLIDADEAYKVLTDYYHIRTEIQHKALKEAMERVPTVDAVEVVKCEGCKWQMTAYCPMPSWEQKDNHYCYKGEKKDA